MQLAGNDGSQPGKSHNVGRCSRMTVTVFRPTRRHFLSGAAACLATGATGCQSLLPDLGAGGDGASLSATQHLARIRTEHGLPPLQADARLEEAARQQAAFMARTGKMTHDTGWGRGFASRMRRNDVDGAAAENVAHGRMDLDRLFSMWMNSAGHRRNMLDPRFRHFGLGSADSGSDGERYWALVLGR